MASVLRYGTDSWIDLDLSDTALLAECGSPSGRVLEAPAEAAAHALSDPLEFPSLARSTTPGDRVCIAVDRGVPRSGELAAVVVRCLLQAGVAADGITVLRTSDDFEAHFGDPEPWLSRDVADRITLAEHHPERRQELGYLAATEKGHPILLNRAIHDADVVLPIGCIRGGTGARDRGVHSPIFPTFSDRQTLMRYRSPSALNARGSPKAAVTREVDEVGWLLGVALTLQVIPGPGEEILHVLAGEVGAVRRRGRELYEAAWRCSAPRRASLVVAAIEGGPAFQTWEAVGDALSSAARLVEDGGSIALCCELQNEPGPAVENLQATESRAAAMTKIRRERPVDALPATQLARVLDRAKVYLLSRLDETLVEDLQIAPIREPAELARLARRHESCILLSNAPYAVVTMEDGG